MVVQYILFVLAFILFSLVYPISGYFQKRHLAKNEAGLHFNKIEWYRKSMMMSWIPTIIIVSTTLLCGFSLKDLGFSRVEIESTHLNIWVIYSSILVFLVYLGYNVYSMIVLKISKESRQHSLKQLPEDIIAFLPVNKKERKAWTLVSITAGISEEVQYRGYLFFAIPLIFPQVSIWMVLFISSLLFGIGHIYQGKSAIRPTLAGLLFGFLYIVFNSIVPIIILHIAQDLVVRNLMDE